MRPYGSVPRVFSLGIGLGLLAASLSISPASAQFRDKVKIPEQPVLEGLVPVDDKTGGGVAAPIYVDARFYASRGIVREEYKATSNLILAAIQELQSAVPKAQRDLKINIVVDPIPGAFALSGNNIVVSTGMLDAVKGSPEYGTVMTYILAHELSHLMMGHPREYKETEDQLNALADALTVGARIAGLKVSPDFYKNTQVCQKPGEPNPAYVLSAAIMTGSLLKAELTRYVFAPYRREAEVTADFLATDLLATGGVADPISGSRGLETIFPSYTKTREKLLKARLQEVEKTIAKSLDDLKACAPQLFIATLQGVDLETQVKGFVKRQILSKVADWVKNRMDTRNIHLAHSSDVRIDAIGRYIKKFYPELGIPEGEVINPALRAIVEKLPKTFEVDDKSRRIADEVEALLAKGDMNGAWAKVLEAEKQKIRPETYSFLLRAGIAASGVGETDKAIAYFEKAAKHSGATAEAFRHLALSYVAKGQKEKALGALDRGQERIGSEKQFIVTRISVLQQFGDTAGVAASLARCEALDDRELLRNCKSAAGIEEKGILEGVKDVLPPGTLPLQ